MAIIKTERQKKGDRQAVRRQNTADVALSSGNECPKCNGTGYITSRDEEGRLISEPCPACRKKKINNNPTGIPAKYHDTDLNSFQFDVYSSNVDGLKKVVTRYFEKYPICKKQGKGLYLWSKATGSGKTFLSCCLARSIMIKYDLQIKFITAPDYLKTVGEKAIIGSREQRMQVKNIERVHCLYWMIWEHREMENGKSKSCFV